MTDTMDALSVEDANGSSKSLEQVQASRNKLLMQIQQEMSGTVAQKYQSEWGPCALWHHRNVKLRFPTLAALPELQQYLLPDDIHAVYRTPNRKLAAKVEEVVATLASKREE